MSPVDQGYWVIAAFQHLKAFSLSAENIHEFDATREAGAAAAFLNAVRGRGAVSFPEMLRIAKAQRISERHLKHQLIPTLERVGSERVAVTRTSAGDVVLEEHLDTNSQLYGVVAAVWESLEPSLIERGSVYVLQHTFVRPRTRREQLGLLSSDGLGDAAAQNALAVATSFEIVRSFGGEGADESVIFNPYIWRANQEKIARAIVRLPDAEKDAIDRTVEIVSRRQAMPVEGIGLERPLLTTAQAVGLVDLVQVNTAAGDKQEFLFTPHLTTHPDEAQFADDLLNDVRAVLACVGYGEHYSKISRLGGPDREVTIRTLRKLLREKEAGDATAIGVDYNLLEERGIISVEPTPTPPGGRYKMRLLRDAPVSIALRTIEASVGSARATPAFVRMHELDPATVFASPEETRVRMAPDLGRQPEHVREAREYYLSTIRKEVF